MSDTASWLVVLFALLAIEIFTGTYYLLMLSVGAIAAALCALAGLELMIQIIVGSVVGLTAVILFHRIRMRQRAGQVHSSSNPDVVLDIGQEVRVAGWKHGHARVEYRGSQWDAIPESEGDDQTGALVIKAIRGSTLVLGRAGSTN